MRKASLIVALALLLQLALPALATQALSLPFDLERLCREATQVVWGEVLSVAPHWDVGGKSISSTVRVAANQVLKGGGGETLTLEVEGGELDGIGEWVEDAPRFAAGEETIVFVDAHTRVLGGAQGKFTVAGGRVVEADMQTVSAFVSGVLSRLAALGVPLENAGTAGAVGGRRVVQSVAQLDTKSARVAPSVAEQAGITPLAPQILLEEGFEGAFPGAWTLKGAPSWGTVTYRAHNGSHSNYCAAASTGAVLPPGPYPANVNTQMVWGPFSLAEAVDANLTFWHHTRTEAGVDFLRVMVSLDGVSYCGLAYSGDWTTAPGNVDGWVADTLDLTAVQDLGNLCGQPEVYLAIWFTSDGSGADEGAYVDDIVLSQDLGEGGAPQITAVEPGARAAGIGQTVTLTGRSLGAVQGTGSVLFWSRQSAWVAAPVVSWSDTRVVCRVPVGASSHTAQAIRLQAAVGVAYAGFTVKWSYLGYRWPGNPVLVRYYVGAGTADCVGENAAVRQGASAWTTVDMSYHALKFWGTTSREAPALDDANVVTWRDAGATGALATTRIWYEPGLEPVLEFDVVFNDYYLWSASADCPSNRYDVRNVAAHEFGHALGLADLYGDPDMAKTLYGFVSAGEVQKRSLSPEDVLGIQWIY